MPRFIVLTSRSGSTIWKIDSRKAKTMHVSHLDCGMTIKLVTADRFENAETGDGGSYRLLKKVA